MSSIKLNYPTMIKVDMISCKLGSFVEPIIKLQIEFVAAAKIQ